MSKSDARQLNGVSQLYKARQLAGRCIAPNDKAFEQLYPNLFSLLGDNRVDVDKVCDPVRLTFQNNAGDWLVSLSCSSLQTFGSVTSSTFQGALDEVEKRLDSNTFPFQVTTKRKPKIRDLEKPKV